MKEENKNFEKKHLIIAGIVLVSIIIILFGGALIYNKFFNTKSYSEIETIMLNAAKEHFEKNEEKLPKNINDSITLTDKTLVKSGEMKPIDSYTKNKNVTCSGKVTVTNINNNYRYSTILDCEDAYKTQTFMDYIKENVSTVTDGDGLYELNNELVYRGDKVNNYLKINNYTYRIVKFQDNHPVIILTDKSESVVWDNRYNIEQDEKSGINDYEISRIREHLNTLYNNTEEDALLTKNDKLLVIQHSAPIGKRKDNDTDKTGALEKAKVLTEQYISLLPVSDYLNASLDKNCTTTISKSCANYNYLGKYKYNWWTATANSETTYRAYRINDGVVSNYKTDSYTFLRPVLHLAKDAIYVSGDGSYNKPFIIK